MIARMKKFVLVAWGADAERAPAFLRKLGIAHVEAIKGSGESCADLERRLRDLRTAHGVLSARSAAKTGKMEAGGSEPEALAVESLGLSAMVSARHEEIARLKRETDRIRDWGDFDPGLIAGLEEAGLRIRLYEGSAKSVIDSGTSGDFIRLSSPRGKLRVAAIGEQAPSGEFAEFRLPSSGLSALEGRIEAAKAELSAAEARLDLLAPRHAELLPAIRHAEMDLLLENLKSGMPGREGLRYLGGYVPAEAIHRLRDEAAARAWALATDDPADDELPPTKVENSAAVRIVQPVFDFLGMVPGYREYDISAWFLGFFTLYFAMIYGDGGYGVIMLGAAAWLTIKSRKPLSDALKLLYLLGGATVLWGLVTGTWFALPFEALPGFLKATVIPWISNENPESGTNVKIFCFAVGAAQLAIAHLKNVRRDFPNLKFLSQVGSLLMITGMFNAVLNLVIDSARFPLQDWALALIGAGFMMVVVFGNWDGKLLRSIVEGLKGIIPTFFGTVSVFADIVSYIRLWAIGLAGIAISQTVNGMAIKMFGDPAGRLLAFLIGALMGILLIGVGHALNLVMSLLSVLVHGIRLNTLEFSSHLGMEWSGYKYDPLREEPAGAPGTPEQERGRK